MTLQASEAAALARDMRQLARENFHVFAQLAFKQLHDEPYQDNWHIAAIAHQLNLVANGDIARLIITMPPRTMKSFLASVCLPAWLLGRGPSTKLICASYAPTLQNRISSSWPEWPLARTD